MSMSDPLGDMLTRIRNGQAAHKSAVSSPSSKLRKSVLSVLEREGFIRGFSEIEERKGVSVLNIELKYYDSKPVIRELRRESKPSLRRYSKISDLPRVRSGLGVYVLSTPKGVMSDAEARDQHVGGEVLCSVF